MTIDEAIKDLRYDAQCNRADLDIEWAERNEQFAEWLEELQRYRKDYAWTENRAYNNAIDDLIFKINEHKTKGYVTGTTHNPFEFGACQMADDIVKIAEQLKAGGKNDD